MRKGAILAALLLAGGLWMTGAPLSAGDDLWRRALPPYAFHFNRDHASHPEYKVEWWYYTGNVATEEGRRFGYQLTFFRVGVDYKPANPSRWAVRDLYMTHLAISDLDGNRFLNAERINRAGVDWAGAETERYRVWNEDWEAGQDAAGRHRLRADDAEIGLELDLDEGKPPVLHGAQGVSQKGSHPGNASHYYSLTRMPTRGTLRLGGERFRVTGASWMDHEFGTSFLEPGQLGWDWLSIQLDDGTDLMLYQFRRPNGERDPHSHGTSIDAAGAYRPIAPDQFDLTPGARWRSPASGANYPIEWRAVLPDRQLDLRIRAALADQELRTSQSTGVNYWEGSIDVVGTHAGRPVRGRGYLEMTGYAGAAMGVLSE